MEQKRFKSLVSLQPAKLIVNQHRRNHFMGYKDLIRQALNFMHLDLTRNLAYDRMTKLIMKQTIGKSANCIDVGCHKGEIMDVILKLAPEGKHFGFEPIPGFYDELKNRYSGRATILPYALGDHHGTTTFHYVKNAPAYSGIEQREYNIESPEIDKITVEIRTLDEVIPAGTPIHFVKIDVEGGEFGVFKGGVKLLTQYQPTVIFECGKGASEYYGTTPAELYDFVTGEIGLHISLLKSFIKKRSSLTRADFVRHFEENKEYYFVAHP